MITNSDLALKKICCCKDKKMFFKNMCHLLIIITAISIAAMDHHKFNELKEKKISEALQKLHNANRFGLEHEVSRFIEDSHDEIVSFLRHREIDGKLFFSTRYETYTNETGDLDDNILFLIRVLHIKLQLKDEFVLNDLINDPLIPCDIREKLKLNLAKNNNYIMQENNHE